MKDLTRIFNNNDSFRINLYDFFKDFTSDQLDLATSVFFDNLNRDGEIYSHPTGGQDFKLYDCVQSVSDISKIVTECKTNKDSTITFTFTSDRLSYEASVIRPFSKARVEEIFDGGYVVPLEKEGIHWDFRSDNKFKRISFVDHPLYAQATIIGGLGLASFCLFKAGAAIKKILMSKDASKKEAIIWTAASVTSTLLTGAYCLYQFEI